MEDHQQQQLARLEQRVAVLERELAGEALRRRKGARLRWGIYLVIGILYAYYLHSISGVTQLL